MNVFITGTDTNIGKTFISAWLCLHTGYDYFKPIQTGSIEGTDSAFVKNLANVKIHPENYLYKAPVSPHLAAQIENDNIDINRIQLPSTLTGKGLIVEGAGGLLVPLNRQMLMIDLIQHFSVPVILVARSTLGTINHTLLSIEALRRRQIPLLGIIVNGEYNRPNCEAIEYYGNTTVLAEMPKLDSVNTASLLNIPPGKRLHSLFEV